MHGESQFVAKLGDDLQTIPVLNRDSFQTVEDVFNVGVVNGWNHAHIDLKGEGMRCVFVGTKLDVVLVESVAVIEVVGAGVQTTIILAAGDTIHVEADTGIAV